jgi:hypothetical protein
MLRLHNGNKVVLAFDQNSAECRLVMLLLVNDDTDILKPLRIGLEHLSLSEHLHEG